MAEEFILLDNYNVSGNVQQRDISGPMLQLLRIILRRIWGCSEATLIPDWCAGLCSSASLGYATSHGKSVKIYGEASVPVFDKNLKWTDILQQISEWRKDWISNYTISNQWRKYSARPILHLVTMSFWCDACWCINKRTKWLWEDAGDQLLNWWYRITNDHTGGTRPGLPTPRAMVADNDLALGRIVEALQKQILESTVFL